MSGMCRYVKLSCRGDDQLQTTGVVTKPYRSRVTPDKEGLVFLRLE